MDNLISSLIIVFVKFLMFLPYKARLIFFNFLFKCYYSLSGKARNVSNKNLEIVFPNLTLEERRKILVKSCLENSRLLADYLELPRRDKKWFAENIDLEQANQVFKVLDNKPALWVSGHLGSFEYLLYAVGLMYMPVAYIARSFKQQKLDTWWNSLRQTNGNILIPRKGATRLVLQNLAKGINVGFLFDQNLTREKSVFVPWFGVPAATTKTVSLAVLDEKVPLVVSAIIYKNGKYKLLAEIVDFSEILSSELKFEEKQYQITLKATEIFERYIKEFPEGWFWMHSRWRTRPKAEDVSIY